MTAFSSTIPGESTLTLTRTILLRMLGIRNGWNPDPSQWVANDTTIGNDTVDTGLRNFYGAHDWSFLRPTHRMSMAEGTLDYPLPDDYAGLVGDIVYGSDNIGWRPVTQTSINEIHRWQQGQTSAGWPTRYAIEPLPMTGESVGQRWSISFDKAPSDSHEARFQYYSNPYSLTSSKPYPLGGPLCAEALRESILATAELVMDEEPGIHSQNFPGVLQRAIDYDLRTRTPRNIGKNHDPSQYGAGWGHRPRETTTVLYNNTPLW